MKRFLLLFLALPVFADVPVPPAATQAQVNAGTATFPYVSPATLAGATSLPAPAGVVTNGGALATAVADNIPMPFAWWDARTMTNASGVVQATATWPDVTGNVPPLNLCNRFSYGAPLALWNPTACNGNPAVSPAGNKIAYSNSIFGSGIGYTNYAVFCVYNSAGFGSAGSYLYGFGTTGGNSLEFADETQPQGTSEPWVSAQYQGANNFDVNRGPFNLTEITGIECGFSPMDPSYWQDGQLQFIDGARGLGYSYYLTNQFALFASPHGISSGISGWFNPTTWLAEVLIYTNALSPYDCSRVNSYLMSRYYGQTRSLVLDAASEGQAYWTQPNSNLVSLVQDLMPPNWVVTCSSQGASIVANIVAMATNEPVSRNLKGSVHILWPGGGDTIYAGLTNFTLTYITNLQNAGASVGLATMLSKYAYDVTYPTFRTNYNNWIYSNYNAWGCFLVDLAGSSTNLGYINAFSNSMWFGPYPSLDAVPHPNSNAYSMFIAPTIANSICITNTVGGKVFRSPAF